MLVDQVAYRNAQDGIACGGVALNIISCAPPDRLSTGGQGCGHGREDAQRYPMRLVQMPSVEERPLLP